MNRWLALAKEPNEKVRLFPDIPTEPDRRGLCPVFAGCRERKLEVEKLRPADPPRAFSITGRPLTWTGRVVSLDEWRKLPEWDRHGPDGSFFCGICGVWVKPEGCPHCSGSSA